MTYPDWYRCYLCYFLPSVKLTFSGPAMLWNYRFPDHKFVLLKQIKIYPYFTTWLVDIHRYLLIIAIYKEIHFMCIFFINKVFQHILCSSFSIIMLPLFASEIESGTVVLVVVVGAGVDVVIKY